MTNITCVDCTRKKKCKNIVAYRDYRHNCALFKFTLWAEIKDWIVRWF